MTKETAPEAYVEKIAGGLRNRIVGHRMVDPAKLLAHPKSCRIHSANQEAAVERFLQEVGWVTPVLVNKNTGRIIDGHLRVELAKKRNEKKIPVAYVSLSENEEDLVLTMLNPPCARSEARPAPGNGR